MGRLKNGGEVLYVRISKDLKRFLADISSKYDYTERDIIERLLKQLARQVTMGQADRFLRDGAEETDLLVERLVVAEYLTSHNRTTASIQSWTTVFNNTTSSLKRVASRRLGYLYMDAADQLVAAASEAAVENQSSLLELALRACELSLAFNQWNGGEQEPIRGYNCVCSIAKRAVVRTLQSTNADLRKKDIGTILREWSANAASNFDKEISFLGKLALSKLSALYGRKLPAHLNYLYSVARDDEDLKCLREVKEFSSDFQDIISDAQMKSSLKDAYASLMEDAPSDLGSGIPEFRKAAGSGKSS